MQNESIDLALAKRLGNYFTSVTDTTTQAYELRQMAIQIALEALADTSIGDKLYGMFELADAIDGKDYLNLKKSNRD